MSDLARPEWLVPCAVAVALAAIWVLGGWLLARRRARNLLGTTLPGPSSLVRDLIPVAALALLAVAWLGPRMGERTLRVPASGADVVLLLDVSRSMEAADVPPTRLARARRAAEDVLRHLRPGDRAALVAFATRGVLLTPLTPDRGALLEMLPALDPELMPSGGSNLADGVRAGVAAFRPDSERPRVLVVLSDGEDPAHASDLGIADAAQARTRVIALAFGSEAGAPVPDAGVPLRDRAGQVVVSRRDLARLGRLAAGTGGAVLAADAWGVVDLERSVAEIRRDAGARPGEVVERRVPARPVAPFAAAALALLALELAGPFRDRRLARRGVALTALALVLVPLAGADPGAADPRARVLLELGLGHAHAGRWEEAQRKFLAAALTARSEHRAALAYYDLGVALLETGALEEARDAFFDALALAPRDAAARFNLEWTLRALAAQTDEATEEELLEEQPAPTEVPFATDRAAAEQGSEPPRTEAPGRAPDPQLPAFDAEELKRWLAAVEDDPARGLRRTARTLPEQPAAQRPAGW